MVRWTGDARGLLRLGLVVALLALHALVHGAIEVRSWGAHGQRALLHGSRAHLGRGTTQGTVGARGLHALCTVGATWTRLATVLGAQLLSRGTLVPTLVARGRLSGSRGLSKATQFAGEGSLTGLEESKATRLAEARLRVQVLASGTTLLAVACGTSSSADSDSSTSSDVGTTETLRLTSLGLVVTLLARHASLVGGLVEGTNGAGHAVWHHHHLTNGTGVF